MSIWRKYQKTALQEMRDCILGEDLTGISVAAGETPKEGGKIARDGQGSQWYVSPEFMADNYALAAEGSSHRPSPDFLDRELLATKAEKFVRHIAGHLPKGQKVCCKICGKTIDEIA